MEKMRSYSVLIKMLYCSRERRAFFTPCCLMNIGNSRNVIGSCAFANPSSQSNLLERAICGVVTAHGALHLITANRFLRGRYTRVVAGEIHGHRTRAVAEIEQARMTATASPFRELNRGKSLTLPKLGMLIERRHAPR